ncbi:UDP-2,4-diacetamido-2,4,6-trideoxy-beta-L-altropyranose hydrolase [Paucibacter sp. B51]|uniref:UDP-2,4-diacetamido-2,4, 6-trideoxy-beta-L-altropyranose hydrolase n=1 Tax=Paucibacter sp. B51 TaxID=2993315 RepID=UPI0022EC0D8A|nr:UDP-2,4-diacetamido-2,4,6-trideoxy-beta-L-altropyranose hydrolase [Paucibacter sp. B51]
MRILIRADASRDIGVGHVKRCLSLGQALTDCGAEVTLLTRLRDVDTRSMAAQAGIACTALPDSDEAGGMVDAETTANHVARDRTDWVIVDHYGIDEQWHRRVAEAGARIAAIDDLADRPLDASVLIDQNEADHPSKYVSVLAASTPILGGPRFAMLSSAYADAPRWQASGSVRSIGIFMGGTDAAAMSEVALRACREHAGFEGPIEIATTSGNERLLVLRDLCEADPRTSLLVDAADLTRFFARHDLQIGAGGGATWERCCVGAPTLLLRCAPNQDAVIPALVRRGVVRTVAPTKDRDTVAVGDALRELMTDAKLRATLSRRSLDTVDGLGARRVALYLLADTLRVRPATPSDGQLLHAWRNHPSTREMSADTREIGMEEHLAWYTRALQDPSRSLLVAMIGAVPVGSIRFDRLTGGELEVSLYLDPALHGLRLGTRLLARGEQHMAARRGAPTEFIATVLDGNLGSRRLFASAGYRHIGDRWRKPAA